MNCRTAQDQLLAARDAPAGAARDAPLAAHLATCAECRELEARLAAATDAWRETSARVALPDAQTEWHAVRRRIRQDAPAVRSRAGWPRWLILAAPLAAAAAVALVFWQSRPPAAAPTAPIDATSPVIAATAPDNDDWAAEFAGHFALVAHAEFVETDNEDASPFVYVDDESGWLIVWASDPSDDASI